LRKKKNIINCCRTPTLILRIPETGFSRKKRLCLMEDEKIVGVRENPTKDKKD